MGIMELIGGWKRVNENNIPKNIHIQLKRKEFFTASAHRRKKGFKRHIRKGNTVYRVIVPPEIMLQQGGGISFGYTKYYKKKL